MPIDGIKNEIASIEYRHQSHWVAISVGVIIVILVFETIGVSVYLYRKRFGFSVLDGLIVDKASPKRIPTPDRQFRRQGPGPRQVSEPIQGAQGNDVVQVTLLTNLEAEPRSIPPPEVTNSNREMVRAHNATEIC